MTDETGRHRPGAEFRGALEREVARALKRERAGAGVSRWRIFASQALSSWRLAAALAIGVFVGAAPAQVQDARQRSELIEAATAEERIALLRVEQARENFRIVSIRFDLALVPRGTVDSVEAELRAREADIARIRLDMAEIALTAKPPSNELDAPLVNGRDFVLERIQLEIPQLEKSLAHLEENLAFVRQRRQLDVVSQGAVVEAEAELERVKARVELVLGRKQLREKFIKGELTGSAAKSDYHLLDLQTQLRQANFQKRIATDAFEIAKARHQAGQSTRAELLEAELRVLTSEHGIMRIDAMIAALKRLRASGSGG